MPNKLRIYKEDVMWEKKPETKCLNEAQVKEIVFKIFSGLEGCSISAALDILGDMRLDIANYTHIDFDKPKTKTKDNSKFIFKHPELVPHLDDLTFESAFLVLANAEIMLYDYSVVNFDNDYYRRLVSENAEQVKNL
jgi:hypothetical protein